MTESHKAAWMTAKALPEGCHVHLLSHGHHMGSGVIDTWMPDSLPSGFGSITEQASPDT